MENKFDYKDEIISSRVGYLGGSDGNLLCKIDNLGSLETITDTEKERLAICKGIFEKSNDIKTCAMGIGDDVENAIFELFHSTDERWQSNPRIESVKYKRKNVGLLVHIDFMLKDEKKKTVTFVECKATKKGIKSARYDYRNQLFIESVLGKEYAQNLGHDWKFNLKLCHYDTNDYDGTIDTDKVSMSIVKFGSAPFNLSKSMDLVNDYLENLTEYQENGVVPMNLTDLPKNIQKQMPLVKEYWQKQNTEEYKHYKELIEAEKAFKDYMYNNMLDKNITERIDFIDIGKSIKLKKPYDKIQFDLNEFKDSHKKLFNKFSKKVTVKGSVLVSNLKEK